MDGLPGVATNILAARLADLQAAELVGKRALPPPTAVTVYELTEAGRALASSIRALSEWGEEYAAPATEDQVVRPAWILLSAARRGPQLEVGSSCELRVGRDVFELTGTDGELSVAATSARSPDAVITIEPDLLYALATRRITPQAARKRAGVNGDGGIAARVLEGLSGCASNN